MKKKFILYLMCGIVFISSTGCIKHDKLYSESELLNYLQIKYDTNFTVVSSEKINNDRVEYVVALQDNPEITFDIVNEREATGSDIGSKKNFVLSSEIDEYFNK